MLKLLMAGILLLSALAAGVAVAGYMYWQQALDQPVSTDTEVLYEVPEGAGLHRVIDDLAQRELVKDAWAMTLLVRLMPESLPSLRAGEFRVAADTRLRELPDLFASDQVVTYPVTIPEGWTFAQMRARLAKAPKLIHVTSGLSDQEIMALLGYPERHPEGRFFPDTYLYRKGMTDLDLLEQASHQMEEVLAEVWRTRVEPDYLETPYEALIMASLIERETGAPEERREIAGVFKRRLALGMRLQTDPTVIYGMGSRYEGRITRKDLTEATAYNTYVIDGLPPTPIAMPGRAALEAALDPLPGDTLYFVSKGDGTHHFSRTLREHNNAVNRYIRSRQ